jgi:hypothetical protein
MTGLHEALEIVGRAEAELRALIEKALTEQRYRDVAALAAVADKQAELVAAVGGTGSIDAARISVGGGHLEPDSGIAAEEELPGTLHKRPKRGAANYPRFQRDGDKLVKIGWSKQDARTYEHRAPKSAVFAFVKAVNELAGDGRLFTMEDVLPVVDGDAEVPTYQAYLALAWLRSMEAIERQGKNGYVVRNSSCSPEAIKSYWSDLTGRKWS